MKGASERTGVIGPLIAPVNMAEPSPRLDSAEYLQLDWYPLD